MLYLHFRENNHVDRAAQAEYLNEVVIFVESIATANAMSRGELRMLIFRIGFLSNGKIRFTANVFIIISGESDRDIAVKIHINQS